MILLGAPGAGKGTQADLLSERLGACQLSMGDVFRAAKVSTEEPSPAVRSALERMDAGELVSDAIVVDMLRERSGCLRCGGGFLLDGFPRTLGQAQALTRLLEEMDVWLDGVLCYEMPLEGMIHRLGGRRTCQKCKAVYHIENQPPVSDGVCDRCGGGLFQRDDDRPEAIRVRMELYEQKTAPLKRYYWHQGLLRSVEASGTPDEVFERSLQYLA